mgnify:CR=1 FL=1
MDDLMAKLDQYPVVVMTLVSFVAFCIMYTLGQLSESGALVGGVVVHNSFFSRPPPTPLPSHPPPTYPLLHLTSRVLPMVCLPRATLLLAHRRTGARS